MILIIYLPLLLNSNKFKWIVAPGGMVSRQYSHSDDIVIEIIWKLCLLSHTIWFSCCLVAITVVVIVLLFSSYKWVIRYDAVLNILSWNHLKGFACSYESVRTIITSHSALRIMYITCPFSIFIEAFVRITPLPL